MPKNTEENQSLENPNITDLVLELKNRGVPDKLIDKTEIQARLASALEKGVPAESARMMVIGEIVQRWMQKQSGQESDPIQDNLEDMPEIQNPNSIKSQVEKQAPKSDMMLKSPTVWTREELNAAMKVREKTGVATGQKARMMGREKAWFDHFYGNRPVEHDETGRMIQPVPVRPVPVTPQPIMTRDGVVLDEALDDFYTTMPVHEEPDEPNMVKAIQSGLNVISGKDNASALPGADKQTKLKEDGLIGPKTAFALKKAVVDQGAPKVSEAVALGQFKNTVKQAKKGQQQNLSAELSRTFDPLLPKKKSPKAAFQPEGLALQDTLKQFGADLKDDGIVGPKTEAAFRSVAKTQDEDRLVESFGENLGFKF